MIGSRTNRTIWFPLTRNAIHTARRRTKRWQSIQCAQRSLAQGRCRCALGKGNWQCTVFVCPSPIYLPTYTYKATTAQSLQFPHWYPPPGPRWRREQNSSRCDGDLWWPSKAWRGHELTATQERRMRLTGVEDPRGHLCLMSISLTYLRGCRQNRLWEGLSLPREREH